MPSLILRPDSNGDQNEWDGQYPDSGNRCDKVNETTPDEDSTYIYTNTSGEHEGYGLSSSGLTDETINSITVYARLRKTTSDGCIVRLEIWPDGAYNRYPSGDKYPTTSYADYLNEWTTNPHTSQPWTVADIEGLRAGIVDNWLAGGEVRCTQIWVIVDYTAAGPETYTKTWNADVLFKKLGIPKALSVDAAFQKQGIPETFGLDVAFQKSFIIQKQMDVLLKRLDATKTFGLDAFFGAVEAETYIKNFALDAVFAYKVRLPELWFDENGKIVLNISKPYIWVGT